MSPFWRRAAALGGGSLPGSPGSAPSRAAGRGRGGGRGSALRRRAHTSRSHALARPCTCLRARARRRLRLLRPPLAGEWAVRGSQGGGPSGVPHLLGGRVGQGLVRLGQSKGELRKGASVPSCVPLTQSPVSAPDPTPVSLGGGGSCSRVWGCRDRPLWDESGDLGTYQAGGIFRCRVLAPMTLRSLPSLP